MVSESTLCQVTEGDGFHKHGDGDGLYAILKNPSIILVRGSAAAARSRVDL